jgi:choline dehydrogenase-like flavoprotein
VIISANDIKPGDILHADVVVVGSGAAGIPLSLQLADANLKVILLEAGGNAVQNRDQNLYAGSVIDPSLHSPTDKYRQRCLGGSTVTWGGRCVPLDDIDLASRAYIPLSGWPISIDELNKYLPIANEWLEAGECEYKNSKAFPDSVPPLIKGFDSDLIAIDSLERFSRPTDLFSRYRSRLESQENVKLVYDANCTSISLNRSGKTVEKLIVSTLDKNVFHVTSSHYVLAVGGIETARLLLASNDVKDSGVGNENDVVGRYYMCHIAGNVGRLKFSIPIKDIRHGYEISPEGIYCRRRISLVESEQSRRKINNVVFRLHFPRIADPAHRSGVLSLIYMAKPFISYEYGTRLRDGDGDTFKSMLLHLRNVLISPLETARFLIKWVAKRNLASRKFPSIILENKTNRFSLEINGEQIPTPESRIYLSDEKDELGIPRVVVDWRYSAQDIHSVKETLKVLQEELTRLGIGELEFDENTLEDELLRFGAYGGHHIGTARMGTDPMTSVVDRNCKVHDVGNLYIAGSAVFPTSSQANPTLTLTALAVRLADHIMGLFSQEKK